MGIVGAVGEVVHEGISGWARNVHVGEGRDAMDDRLVQIFDGGNRMI